MRFPLAVSSRKAEWPSQVRVVSDNRSPLRAVRPSVTREDHPGQGRTSLQMGSRLLPLVLASAALVADVTSHERVASYAVLLAVVGAAAAAFVGVGSLLEGKGSLVHAVTTVLALVLLLTGSVVRASAP